MKTKKFWLCDSGSRVNRPSLPRESSPSFLIFPRREMNSGLEFPFGANNKLHETLTSRKRLAINLRARADKRISQRAEKSTTSWSTAALEGQDKLDFALESFLFASRPFDRHFPTIPSVGEREVVDFIFRVVFRRFFLDSLFSFGKRSISVVSLKVQGWKKAFERGTLWSLVKFENFGEKQDVFCNWSF